MSLAAPTSAQDLPASARAQLERQGFLRLEGLLTPAEIAAMHAAWERRMAVPDAGAASNWGPQSLENEPEFAVCAAHPRILAAVGHLLDGDVHPRTLRGRAPPLGHGRQGLHVDWARPVDPDHQLLINAFCALDAMTLANGATRLVPGSHRWGRAPRGPVAQPHGAHPHEQIIEVARGDALVFSAHLWHSGTRNASGERRRVVLAQFARSEVPLQLAGGDDAMP